MMAQIVCTAFKSPIEAAKAKTKTGSCRRNTMTENESETISPGEKFN
jgi:hypothetical protein